MNFLDAAYDRSLFLTFVRTFLPDFALDEREFKTEDNFSVFQLGKSKTLNLSVLEFAITPEESERRITITQRAFKLMRRHSIRNAIIAFHYGDSDWRLSLLTSTLKLNDDGRVVSEESNPRRYSYLLGPETKTNTPKKFLLEKGPIVDLNDLLSRFSVEVVNKQFYNSVVELFMKLVGGQRGKVKYTGELKVFGQEGPSQSKQEFAVRLIGRIVFCWFLKEKCSDSGAPLVSNDLLSLNAISAHADYYHSILEPLFFELLNKPMNSRTPSLDVEPFSDVPYLNGGLFSPQENDYYTQNSFTGGGTPGLVTIPDAWFMELFSVFDQYNFTVDENTSYDVDLSIDPEMLGRIFENLLAEINPQTGESARKSTGSFYTPREIVDYMVDNSLLYYLKDKTTVSKAKLKAIISYGQEDDEGRPLEQGEKQQIVDALDRLTILDPACGSGAFPIGLLQKVVYILQQADDDGRLWFDKQIKNIPSIEMQNDLRSKFEDENYDYIRKLGVIRQSIFGVDIQTIATEIAKLRCFLTLIIEESVDDSKPNRGIHPLPNLDFKFVTANTLVPLPAEPDANQTSLLEDTSHIDGLKSIRDNYFTATMEQRINLRNEFSALQKKMLIKTIDSFRGATSSRYDCLMRWDPFTNASTDWFDSEWMFGVKTFDIVIANPPYVHLEDIKDEANRIYGPLRYKTYEKRGDLYSLFFERGINLLKEQGILTFITSNKWMRAGYGKSLRNFFVDNTHPIQLIDLGGGVFESATVDTDILILKKEPYFSNTRAVAANKDLNAKNIASFISEQFVDLKFKKDESWVILSPIEQSIKEKIERIGVPLKDWDIQIRRGVLTGCNEAFIIDEAKRQAILDNCQTDAERDRTAQLIRPILRGRDIKKNGYEWAGLYCICTFPAARINIDDYPAVKQFLISATWSDEVPSGYGRLKLEQTGIQHTIDGVTFKARKKTGNSWFETQDQIAYKDDFVEQKLIYPETTCDANFVLDEVGFMLDKTCFMMIGDDLEYIRDTLKSTLFRYAYKRLFSSVELGNDGYQYNKHALKKLPIAKVYNKTKLSEQEIAKIYELTDEEISFLSSAVNEIFL